MCIHAHEGAFTSIGYVNHVATYGGGYQFLLSTWNSLPGRKAGSLADITHASPREQTYRAWELWKRDGGSFREWGTASACHLR